MANTDGREAEMEQRIREQEQRIYELEAQVVHLRQANERLIGMVENQVNRDALRNDNRLWKSMAANNPPKYNGVATAADFKDWIAEMEKILDLIIECPANKQVKLAAFYLVGPAEIWWRTVSNI